MGLHTYKICDVVPQDDQRVGRPRRTVLVSWFGLTDSRLTKIRRKREPRLRVGQIAEVDGKIVARGPRPLEVVGSATSTEADELDEAEDLDAEDLGDGDDGDDGDDDNGDDAVDPVDADDAVNADNADNGPNPDHPVGVTTHATRMLWDAYQRHAAASVELREQTNELNRRAIAQAKQLDDLLSGFQNRQPPPAPPPPAPPPPPINVNLDDLYNVLRVGASIWKDAKAAGDKDKDKEPPKA
jgi:hypothetical protein